MVHELVVVGLSGAHLEGRAHLEGGGAKDFRVVCGSVVIFAVIIYTLADACRTCPYWFMSLFWVSCRAATVAVAVAVAVAAAAATAAAAAAAAGWVKSPGGRV